MDKLPYVNRKLQSIKQHMRMYYPEDEAKAERKAAGLCLKLGLVLIVVVIYFLIMRSISFCEWCLAFCMFLMASRYVVLKSLEKEESKLLKGLEEFLGELRFQFSYYRRMEDALEETIDRQEGIMYLQGRQLLRALEQEESEEAYFNKVPNRFLPLLYVLCKTMFEYGDREVEGKSVCLTGLGVIKEGIQTELLKKKEITHLFSGLLFTCMIPLAFVKIIEIWATYNLEELKVYYQGGYGMVTTLLLCFVSLFCYCLIQRWQYDLIPLPADRQWLKKISEWKLLDQALSLQINRNYEKSLAKHRALKECGVKENVKQYLLLQYITAVMVSILLFLGLLQYQTMSKNQIVLGTENMICNLYQVREDQKVQISTMVEEVITGKRSLQKEEWSFTNCTKEVQETILAEIQNKKDRWEQWNYPLVIWFLPLVGGVLAYFLRYQVLLLKKRYTGLKREEEIMVFHSVILFLMHMEQMDGEGILKWLEPLAFYFKDSIVEALYRLEYQDYEEIEFIKEKEGNMPMAMILEGIMACDCLPVEEAFAQMESDYHYTIDKYKQEIASYIEDHSAVGKILAFLPLYMTVGFKLIVPFVLEGLSQLSAYSESMKHFM